MNDIQSKILCNLKENELLSQRQLAKSIGVSLGIINREYNELISSGFITEEGRLTKEALKNIKNKFYEEMNKEDVDNLITSMTIEHGLTPVSLSIAEADQENILSYTEYQLQQKKGSSSKNKDGKLKVYNVNLSVSGAITDVQTLVDDVRTTKSLKVSGITYSEEDDEKTTTITFKLFMI